MKSKLPLIRVSIYILVTVVLISGTYFTVHASLATQRENMKETELEFSQKENEFQALSQREQSLYSRLTELKNQSKEIGAGEKILVNKSDLIEYLTLQSIVNEVIIENIKDVDLIQKNDTWEVKYNIGVRGPYENVIEFIDVVSEVGNNYFSKDMNILQAGPSELEDPKGSWMNNEEYLNFELREKNGLEDFYYVGGYINFPIIIDTVEGVRPFLRLKDIVYSDRTISRYDWQVEEAKILIGDEEYGLGYPDTDFNKQEMKLNVDVELKESMIDSEVKGISIKWRSLNEEHEVFIPLQRPIVITEELFSEQPWEGEINQEIARYNLDMLNSIVYTDFNIVFLMDEVPDVYFDGVVEQIEEIKTLAQNNEVSSPDSNTLIIHDEEEKTYTISDNALLLNGKSLFKLNSGQFTLTNSGLKIEFNALDNMNFNLVLEGVTKKSPIE